MINSFCKSIRSTMNGRYRNIFFCSKNDYFTHYRIILLCSINSVNLLVQILIYNKLLIPNLTAIILVKIAE